FAILAFLLTWLLREVPLRSTTPAEAIGESFASPHEDRADRELERILSSITSGGARARIYARILDESGLELAPDEAWLLGRLATRGMLEHAQPRTTTPEEVAALTADLVHRGYLVIDPAGRLELSEQGRAAHEAQVEAGRVVLTRIAAEMGAPE